ncbi:MAG: hypothetical protein AAFY24_13385, partial [Pseudomonadota bacterium]
PAIIGRVDFDTVHRLDPVSNCGLRLNSRMDKTAADIHAGSSSLFGSVVLKVTAAAGQWYAQAPQPVH